MTKLEAVNRVLEAIGEVDATALDTGGTSIEGDAEKVLDRIDKRVQKIGWAVNEQNEKTLKYADRSLVMTGAASGPFTYGETLTEATSGATGTFLYLSGTTVYLRYVSGTFEIGGADRVLTGGTSLATYSSTGLAATITSSKIAYDTTWLRMLAYHTELVNFVPIAGFLYDKDDNTYTFDADVKANVVTDLAWTSLTESLQDYIVAMARIEFQRAKKRGVISDALLKEEIRAAQYAVRQEDTDLRQTNLLKTRQARRLLGHRSNVLSTGNV